MQFVSACLAEPGPRAERPKSQIPASCLCLGGEVRTRQHEDFRQELASDSVRPSHTMTLDGSNTILQFQQQDDGSRT